MPEHVCAHPQNSGTPNQPWLTAVGIICVGLSAVLVLIAPASAQTGFGGTGGGEPAFFGSSPFAPFGVFRERPPPGVPGRSVTVTPAIEGRVIGTDNVNNTARDRQSDIITSLIPSIAVEADTVRLVGRLFYAPTARFYARESDLSGLDHNFSGQMLGTLIEDRFFLDVRGFGGLQSAGGGFGGDGGVPVTDRRNQVQTLGFQISPYVVHRFGTLGSVQVGYRYQYAETDGNDAFLPGGGQPFFTEQQTSAHQGFYVLRSGEDFGRFALEQRSSYTTYESQGGNSVLSGSRRYFATLAGSYALTRQLTLLGELGYENQRYGGTLPFEINGPIWSAGVRYTPNPDSVITVRYGRRDGFNSFFLDSGFNVSARTRIFASYTDQISSPLQGGLDQLSAGSIGPTGNLVNPSTGSSTSTPFGNPLLALQNSIFRTKRATLGITQTWPRDGISLEFFYDERTPLTSAPGTTSFEQTGYGAGLTWTRSLTPNLIGFVGAQYGITESSSAGDGTFYTARLGLSQELARGLFGTVQYILRVQEPDRGDNITQNLVILSLRQTF
jgi:uncharacterized protein (PEP-CTERM system associated)